MRVMRKFRLPVGFAALVLGLVTMGFSAMAFAAPACSLKVRMPAGARTFARVNNQSGWQEYQSLDAVPELSIASGMSAQVWHPKYGKQSVTLVEPGQDFEIETKYCFDEGGELESVSFEIRTALGWGHRVEGTARGGVFTESSSEFFRLKDGKTISQPDWVGGVPQALEPKLYSSVSKLPFAGLLETTEASNRILK
jgi:hypothetical protein